MYEDPYAIVEFYEFVKKHKIDTIVETGTFEGDGIIWASQFVDRLVTMEVNLAYWIRAQHNIQARGWKIELAGKLKSVFNGVIEEFPYVLYKRDGKEIVSIYGSSEKALDLILSQQKAMQLISHKTLFFLDAHWNDYWPINDELKTLAKYKVVNAYITIHDFKHPTKDFDYDEYNGQALDYDFIKDNLLSINPNYKVEYNKKAIEGYRGRGILFASPP